MANIAAPSSNSLMVNALAPDYQAQAMQSQRNYALAQALRQQSLEDSQAPGGGRVSWTQGLGRLAQALSASVLNSRADKQSIAANQGLAAALQSKTGHYEGGGGQASGASAGAPAPAASPTINIPDTPDSAPDGPPQGPPPAAPQPGQPDPLAPSPQGPAAGGGSAQAPSQPGMGLLGQQQPPQAGRHWVPGDWSLTGTPRDASLLLLNQEEMGKAMIGNAAKAAAPTDIEIMQQHRQQAAQAGDWGTVRALSDAMDKANYIAPVNGRPGSTIRDPHDPSKVIGYDAPNIEGAFPTYGPNGMPTGYQQAPGASQAIGAVTGAKTGAAAAAQSHYDMVQVFNTQTGQMEYVPKSQMVGGGAGSGGTPGAGGRGPVGALYGNGSGGGRFAAGAPLGAAEAAGAYGKFSGGAFGDIQAKAANSPQALSSLREMSHLANSGQASTGPAAARLQQWGQEHGLDFLTKPGNFAFNKDAARYIAQSAANVGLNGSDARLGMVANATPGQYMPLAALNKVLPVQMGLEMANMAQADAAGKWGQAHPNDIGGFQSFWRQNYDPTAFTAMAQGPKYFQNQYLPSIPAPQRAATIAKVRALQNAGVNFQAFAQ